MVALRPAAPAPPAPPGAPTAPTAPTAPADSPTGALPHGLRHRLADGACRAFLWAAGPALRFIARNRMHLPATLRQSDALGIQVRSTHFYEPTYRDCDLPSDVTAPRLLPGLTMDAEAQKAFIQQFDYADELRRFPLEPAAGASFHYRNGFCEEGVAELLYSVVRHTRPRRIIEIGAGHSTRMIAAALAANRADGAAPCRHICIEPYHHPWLDHFDVEIVRDRVEHLGLDLFRSLEANDILFIDSSHAVRPFGDVLFEILEVLPSLAPGVLVSIDDIFTPNDYPERWLRAQRRLWTEQYLLEAFLSLNAEFEILCSLAWLYRLDPALVERALPMLATRRKNPGVMWIRRRAAAAG